ncbi:nuclear transport factor 2 family protein [Novispirillum sp. DQ9]|uniref:nuclear transport factor 2 family protein n=1 Tax=Novispirillum sp. DQ9 TaxID=3398612 RepID=UPI003C7DD98D
MMTQTARETLDAYIAFYRDAGPPDIDRLDALTTPDVVFQDPFQTLDGRDAYKRLFHHMWATTGQPRVTVHRTAWDGDTVFLRWRFELKVRGRWLPIEGVSEITFADDGRICRHVDHWDAASQVYGRIPGLGAVLRLIRRRLAAPA